MNNKVDIALRILLGLMMVVFGLNKFLNFIPIDPSEMSQGEQALMGAFVASGYFMPVVAVVEIIAGALFLSNKAVGFAVVFIAPVLFQIIFFHLFLSGIVASIFGFVLLAMWLYIAVYRKERFVPLFS